MVLPALGELRALEHSPVRFDPQSERATWSGHGSPMPLLLPVISASFPSSFKSIYEYILDAGSNNERLSGLGLFDQRGAGSGRNG